MKKKVLSFSIIMFAFLLFVVPISAAGSSGSYSGNFSAYYGIVGKQSMLLSGKKTVSGKVKIDGYYGSNKQLEVKASIATKTLLGGYNIVYTKTVCSLDQKGGSFSWTKKFKRNTYHIYVTKGKKDGSHLMHGKLSYKWR